MAIQIQPAPAAGLDVVRDNLMLPGDDDLVPMNVIEGARAVQIMTPYPVYTADLAALLNGQFLATARLTSWQYVIADDTSLALAEVSAPLAFASLQSGPATEALLDVMSAAEKLELVKTKDYDLRILRAPELYFLAVWLHAPNDEWLLPVRPAPAGLQPGALLTEAQLIGALRPLAEVRLNTPDA